MMFFLFWFLIGLFVPFAFMDSGGSVNNIVAYMFLLMIGITYLFDGWRRVLFTVSLIVVYIFMNIIEYFYPELVAVYSPEAQFIDRILQTPFIFVISFHVLLLFAREYERVHRKLLDLANFDELTGLYNRRIFNKIMEEAVQRNDNSIHLVLLDLDFFKKINDQYGHTTGDEVLIWLANLLKQKFPESIQIVSRWGGDEFAVIYHGKRNELELILNDIKSSFHAYVKNYEKTAGISSSIVSFCDYRTTKETIIAADQILYSEKEKNHLQH